ncbi:MAG: biopolymer transporter ExbD [Bacteroidota bacterium]|nr:biopolymer transporter ExbD [Bacteroidota bacterium]
MNLRNKNKFRAEVSTSSFSDIMFFLMLFFLIISTMINPSVIKLTLPKAQHNQTVRKTEISVSITKDLKYYVNNKEVTLETLKDALSLEITKVKEPTIVIRCDNSIPVQDLIDVMQIGNELKIKMILATKSPNG